MAEKQEQRTTQEAEGDHVARGRTITDEWPIDQAALVAFMGQETADQFVAYLPDFFESSTPKVHDLVSAAEQRDVPALKMAAHALRGGCSMLSMESLVSLCRAVEQASDTGQIDEAVTLAYRLRQEYRLVQAAYGLPVD